MLRATVILATLGLAVTPACLNAQTVDPDVKCMLISNVFASKETDAKRKEVAVLAVAYYLGRIDAKLSPAQLRASVAVLGKQPMGKDIGAVMTACARAMQTKQVTTVQLIQQVGQQQQVQQAQKK